MQNYFSIDEISKEIDVNRNTLYKKAKELDLDTSKLTKKDKTALIKACEDTIKRKSEAKSYLEATKDLKVSKSDEILNQSGSTLEKRLEIAKREFDNVNKALIQVEMAIEQTGIVIMNGNNGTTSMSPAMKVKLELLKQHNALQKTIQDLEDKMRFTITNSINERRTEIESRNK